MGHDTPVDTAQTSTPVIDIGPGSSSRINNPFDVFAKTSLDVRRCATCNFLGAHYTARSFSALGEVVILHTDRSAQDNEKMNYNALFPTSFPPTPLLKLPPNITYELVFLSYHTGTPRQRPLLCLP